MAKPVIGRVYGLGSINEDGSQFSGQWEAFDISAQSQNSGNFTVAVSALSTLLSINQAISDDIANGVNDATGTTSYTGSDVLLLGGVTLLP